MADIVERLAGPFIAEPAAQRVMDQAIEEIERLREWNAEIALNAREFAAENERLRQVLDNVQQARVLQGKAITEASTEIDRLRAALEDIASGKYSGIVLPSMPPQDPAVNRARAALEEGRT